MTERACLESYLVKSSLSSAQHAKLQPQYESQQQVVIESVPLLDLRRQYDVIRDEVLGAITRVCDSQNYHSWARGRGASNMKSLR